MTVALWECKRCSTHFAVGMHKCPQCTGTSVREVGGDDVPKVSKYGGPSNRFAESGGDQDVVDDGLVGETVVPEDTNVASPDAGDDEETPDDGPDYDNMTKDQLIEEAKERGLPFYGNKQDLVDRLVESDDESEEDEAPEES